MNDRMNQALEECWSEYKNYISTGTYYSAIVRLGEVENLLRYGKVRRPLDRKWRSILDQELVSEDRLSLAADGVKADVVRLRHVMSVDDKFIYEEAMLLITLRVMVQLAMDFLESRYYDFAVDTQDVDENLRRVARLGQNFTAYESARRKARKNWGLPIVSEWLDG
ncbi:MAG: hypothetical protein ACOZAM_06660 [Pseudomonadota bacterium]